MFSPSSALIFLPFWPFLTRHQHCFKLFGGYHVFLAFFHHWGVFILALNLKHFLIALQQRAFFFLKNFQCPSTVTLDLYSQNAFF